MRLVLRSVGWLFITAGAVVALYLVYSLYWTGRTTSGAQERLLEELAQATNSESESDFDLEVGPLSELDADGSDPTAEIPQSEPSPGEAIAAQFEEGDAIGLIEFYRPSEDTSIVIDDPVVVVEGVSIEVLKEGPGRYPSTSYPGQPGNFAVAGHRTTYGAPFWNLDQLQDGDEIHVTDREGTTWIYEFSEEVIVAPADVSVLDANPLESDRPVLTLTTCHPRWSQRERLIVHAELSEEQMPLVAAGTIAIGEGAP
ncbi:class E sortase [Euzebya tangerina]|uniref:class E sortase n=1 Tax=Euzebya tangerina TaxID=591198 RepID=UPI000E32288F|nr:class E sortase [Euzebya tangerina]